MKCYILYLTGIPCVVLRENLEGQVVGFVVLFFVVVFLGVVLFFQKLGREKFPSNKKLICDFIIQLS